MTFRISINMDNAAFEQQGAEVSRILQEVRNVCCQFESGIERMNGYKLLDVNGNTVGIVVVEE